MVVTGVGDPELLLGNINTLVQVQVGTILSSNDTEVKTEVLGRVGVCGDLDLGRSSSVGESLQVSELIGRGHTFGAILKEKCQRRFGQESTAKALTWQFDQSWLDQHP